MATKIRLMRLGKIRTPQYRIVISDSRNKRDGKYIESIGQYRPKEEPSFIVVDSERAQYWLSVGAQPTEPVLTLLKLTGDWQQFKGLPAENRVQVAEPKQSRGSRAELAAARVSELAVAQERLKAEKKKTKKTEDEAGSKSKASKDTPARDAAPRDAAPRDAVASKDSVTADTVPDKTASDKAVSEKAASEKAASNKTADGQG